MKTNHQRNFIESRRSRHATLLHMLSGGHLRVTQIGAPKIIAADHPGFDHSNGHRGTARAKFGTKKFIRTRLRFHENQGLNKLIREL